MKTAILVAHATARQVADELKLARSALVERGVELLEMHVVESDKRLRKAVRRAIHKAPDVVIVAGGDGTMTKVVGEFAWSGAVLGVLPLGTGNSFSLSLGIGSDIERAADAIARGEIVKVDLGTIDDGYFANFATIGFASVVAGQTPKPLKRLFGALAYVFAGILPFLRAQSFRCRVKAENETLDFETYQAIVASGRYFGKSPVTPDASVESGKLAFFATTDAGPLDLATTYLALVTQRQTLLANGHVLSSETLKIRTWPRQRISIDGSPFGKTPVRLGVAAKALRVMLSAQPPGTIAS
ncbi:MAG: YegS/Rv2252/BmrU family lipid kinase [Candidatus Eremiobacteraeota bacterium]|nr:YegS/Rv2252/BmrU family lipid kinase [Candidatus Eremiobacteraeota bacterium]MBC5811588.1 YegS/Rv2252/BmrU family lipid kinase [Candidatus Eremiobacteraeota bacterium]